MDKANALTAVLKRLNAGDDPAKVRAEAKQLLATISPADLAIAEQNLIDEGLSLEDLQALCDVHLEVLKDQVTQMKTSLPKGHIVATMVSEHEAILGFLDELDRVNRSIQAMSEYAPQAEEFARLSHIAEHLVETERHHQREEEVLFPELEKRGVHGPPTVMRAEHAELRPRKHALKQLCERGARMDFEDFKRQLAELAGFIVPTLREHIAKENNILYPTALQVIDDDTVWQRLKAACDEIGYCCFTPEA
ncbi:MAG: DUF438 domain-containing protein [Sedimentisphaerales bacterium]|nr:DUF438 domain-containing protein [Sedimentisphaerales bacterium]